MKSIGMNDELHKRLKILSFVLNKKMWELIKLAVVELEHKYSGELAIFYSANDRGSNNE